MSMIVSLWQTLADDNRDYSTARNQLDFLQHVSADKNLREASVAVDKKLSDFDVEIRLDESLEGYYCEQSIVTFVIIFGWFFGISDKSGEILFSVF